MVKSVLIADSDEHNREIVSRLIQIFGYDKVLTASNGLDALYQVMQEKPHLVILDVALPKLDGLLLCEIVRNVGRFRAANVALMAHSVDPDAVKKGLAVGAFGFLEKPVTPEGLKDLLRGLKAKTEGIGEGIGAAEQALLKPLGEACRQTFNLVFGQQARILKTEIAPAESLQKAWDVAGKIRAEGEGGFEIGLGFTESIGNSLCAALSKKGGSTEARKTALDELLNLVMNRALRSVPNGKNLAPSHATVTAANKMELDPKAKGKYLLHLRVATASAILRKQHAVPVFVATL